MKMSATRFVPAVLLALAAAAPARPDAAAAKPAFAVVEDGDRIRIVGSALEAAVRKKGYVTGVEGGSLLDTGTGFRDLGFGLDIVDWVMEAGSDLAYRDKLPGDLPYAFDNLYHGKRPKRCVEGPQICTKARQLAPTVAVGTDFVAVRQEYVYTLAAPGKKAGSKWDQILIFPAGKRYFLSADRIVAANAGELFLRIDLPGHIKHKNGDTFSEVYLSYRGTIPAKEFASDFAPDDKFLYVREAGKEPKRMIRAYRTRDPKTGKDGPWLAGMTLDPTVVSEAWCHQRGYVCMIEEIGGWAVRAGDVFGAAFLIGFFDSVEEMERVYDAYAGHRGLSASASSWKLTKAP